MTKKLWLIFFLCGVALELISGWVQQQYVLSGVSLLFSYSVYYFSYRRSHTALLTFTIWSYWILLGLFCMGGASLYVVHHLGNGAGFLRQIQLTGRLDFFSISAYFLGTLYVAIYLYLTIHLRRINRLE